MPLRHRPQVEGLPRDGRLTVLVRSQPILDSSDAQLASDFASGQDLAGFIGGLYLAPFAGIMFLWFIAVIRDQIGECEQRFYATVFFGSELLFVAMLFAAMAVVSWPVVGVRMLGQAAPSARGIEVRRALSYALLFGLGTRAAAMFLLAMSTVGLKSGVIPGWHGGAGEFAGLVRPARVPLVSLDILRRERTRRRAA